MPEETTEDDASGLAFTYRPNGMPLAHIRIPWEKYFNVYTTIHQIGYERAMELINLGFSLAVDLNEANVPATELDDAFDGLWQKIAGYIRPGEKWKSLEDLILSFTYSLLADHVISRPEAAQIATILLNKHDHPISTDAWRVKVDRWAESQKPKLPKVGLRKRGTSEHA